MHERGAPGLAHDLGAQNDVAQLPRKPRRQDLPAVDRERERVRLLVDAEVVALQGTHLRGTDELKANFPFADPLRGQHSTDELLRGSEVELRARTVGNLDLHHHRYFRRWVPVSSACSLYASTIRWTSL